MKTKATDILTITKYGMGKRTPLKDYMTQRRGGTGIKNCRIIKGDEVVSVLMVSNEDEVFIATKLGMSIRCKISDFRQTRRFSTGVRAIRIRKEDEVVGICIVDTKEPKGEPRMTIT